jgi:hypothetical protein
MAVVAVDDGEVVRNDLPVTIGLTIGEIAILGSYSNTCLAHISSRWR